MFELSLLDLIKGIRAHPESEDAFIAGALKEIKQELKSSNGDIKAQALEKLIYLRGLGYDVSWAEFSVVEIMSQPWYGHKRIAYLGASKMFSPETQLALLVTHSLKKTFTIGSLPMKDNSSIFSNIKIGSKTNVLVNVNPADGIIYEKSAALNCLANIATDVLAETLIGDVFTILTSSSQLLQKKSTLTLFRLIEKNPPSLLDSFERLKAKLLGDDVAVVNAAVNVFCELAKRNPKNYIILAPILFDILAKSSNNWLLIKTCKLIVELIPQEPRLPNKLLSPLMNILSTTPAKSLLFETLRTVLKGLVHVANKSEQRNALRTCCEKVGLLVSDHDPNLKYIGLIALQTLLKDFPESFPEFRDSVVKCLSEPDVTLKYRALDIVIEMVNEKNLLSIVNHLFVQLEGQNNSTGQSPVFQAFEVDEEFSKYMLKKILRVCSKDTYAIIIDFKWYVDLLMDIISKPRLIVFADKEIGTEISSQLLDIALRVPEIQPYASFVCLNILKKHVWVPASGNLDSISAVRDVLGTAAWIVGEFCLKQELNLVGIQDIEEVLMNFSNVSTLPGNVQSLFLHASLKVLKKALQTAFQSAESQKEEGDVGGISILGIVRFLTMSMSQFHESYDFEVQERAVAYSGLLAEILKGLENATDLESYCSNLSNYFDVLFEGEFNPVNPKAQRKVPVPDGLDLDSWINEPWEEIVEETHEVQANPFVEDSIFGSQTAKKGLTEEELEESKKRAIEARLKRQMDPFYLPPVGSAFDESAVDTENQPNDSSLNTGSKISDESKSRFSPVRYTVKRDELPPGAIEEDELVKKPNDLSSIDLNLSFGISQPKQEKAQKSKPDKKETHDLETSEEFLASLWNSQKFLCGDSIVRSKYSSKIISAEDLLIEIEFLLAFKPSKDERLKSAKLKFESTTSDESGIQVELLSDSKELLIAEKQKHAGIFQHTFSLRVSSLNTFSPARFTANLVYELKLKDGQKSVKELPGELSLSLSSFIIPVHKSVDELKQSLSDESVFCKTSTATIDLANKRYSPIQLMHLIPRLLNVAPVKFIKSTGAYFANTLTEIPFAIRFKAIPDQLSAKIDITSPNQLLSDSLLAEFIQFTSTN